MFMSEIQNKNTVWILGGLGSKIAASQFPPELNMCQGVSFNAI
jgi:hypothetical protein